MNKSKAISRLLFKYLKGTLTTDEAIKLDEWRKQLPENQELFDRLSNEAMIDGSTHEQASPKHLEERIFSKISAQIPELEGNVVRMSSNRWKYAAAAAIIVLFVSAGIVMLTTTKRQSIPMAKTEIRQDDDVAAPEGNFASIILADGEKVDLNNSSNGTLASQGKMEVIKTDEGLIVYKAATGKVSGAIQLNTLSNPKGSNVIGMILEDGTKVWLNAGSSLTYPVAFIGNERKVAITGEAYFEVAKNKSKPFKVTRGGMEVKVLGTHFNVNAFSDDPNMKVTLLEGSVKISSGKASGLLHPGQQAKIKDDDIKVQSDINLDQVMAWKNGYFSFEKASVDEVMREIARWYNIEVVYEGKIPDEHFGGDLRRNSRLSSVLKVLEKSGVKFRIEGNKVTVF
jgi:ferric-dicitrate binding protein FerR (iron transport regulator)